MCCEDPTSPDGREKESHRRCGQRQALCNRCVYRKNYEESKGAATSTTNAGMCGAAWADVQGIWFIFISNQVLL